MAEITPAAAADVVHACANLLFWHDSALYTGKDGRNFGDASWMDERPGVAADKCEDALAWLPESVRAAYAVWTAAEEAREIAELRGQG